MIDQHEIAVVVPAYREERLLSRTLERMPAYVDTIVVVDDASPDGTHAVALRCAAEDPRVRVVRHPINRGVGAAIVTGYRRALLEGAHVVAVMAGDAQMDPEDLRDVLRPVVEGRADYVKGNRLRHPQWRRMPPLRRLGTETLAWMTCRVGGLDPLGDAQCGYTAISARILRRLPLERLYPRYGYPNDLLIRLGELDARIEEVVVRPVYAEEVSGLKVHKVVGPIGRILLRGAARRALRRVRQRPLPPTPAGAE